MSVTFTEPVDCPESSTQIILGMVASMEYAEANEKRTGSASWVSPAWSVTVTVMVNTPFS